MTQSLSEVAHKLRRVTEFEKRLKLRKDELRNELFAYGEKDYEGKEYLLPTTTITVPDVFWERTGMSSSEFLQSRFPTWDLVDFESDNTMLTTTFVLRKNPRYAPFKYEDDNLRLSKTVTEPTPEIDFETLEAEMPELFKKITKEKVVRELDGDSLESAIAEDQEVVAILTRHTKYTREPQQRVGIKNAT